MKKKAKKSEKKKAKTVNKDLSETPSIPEKPFDFGGLPDRNLKKNLGC